ncbi:hypothetical protein BJX66DRAFT_90922 [Aspergillus keveii]|uniref:Uncharacterized protein n=1 Tax=Aspergillus keveii TaxID=714993 RepID=A0ABR4FLX0_9EURO
MADFLRRKEVLEADIIALQEPWRNPSKDNTHHPAKATHNLNSTRLRGETLRTGEDRSKMEEALGEHGGSKAY